MWPSDSFYFVLPVLPVCYYYYYTCYAIPFADAIMIAYLLICTGGDVALNMNLSIIGY